MGSHLAKRIFEIDAQGQKCQIGKVAIFCQIAILALLSLCIDFKNSFGQMTSYWVLRKAYYILLLRKCLRAVSGLSMCLSKRINWVISSFPRWNSKILFVLGSWDYFGSLGCRIEECPFRYGLILFLGNVKWMESAFDLQMWIHGTLTLCMRMPSNAFGIILPSLKCLLSYH